MSNQTAFLPDKIWLKIFDLLEYDDLLILIHVNENWTDLVIQVIKSKIVVSNETKEDYETSYFNNQYLVSKSASAFKENMFLHSIIKKLVIFKPLALFNLTNFDNLTSLEIEIDPNFKKINQPIFLALKNLKVFSFCSEMNLSNLVRINSFILELPNLDYLNLNTFEIMHPNSIKKFQCLELTPLVRQFKCVEELIVFDFRRVDNLFEDLKFLKSFIFCYSNEDLDSTIRYLEAKQLINKNLKVFYKNIDIISNPHQQNEVIEATANCVNDEDLEVYFRFIDFIKKGDFRPFLIQIKNLDNLPVEMLKLMENINTLFFFGEITDDQKFIQLISLPSLKKINITIIIGQNHLDLIPLHCKSLRNLEIDHFQNGSFILKLKYLKEFKCKQLISLEFFKVMIKKLYYLKKIEFKDSYEIEIEDGVVQCLFKNEIVLRQPKCVFMQRICLINSWSKIFNYSNYLF